MNEQDLSTSWLPFLKSATSLRQCSKASQVVHQYFEYPFPLGKRDCIIYAFGVDVIEELGCVMIFMTSPPTEATEYMGAKIPPPRKKVQRIPTNYVVWMIFPVDSGRGVRFEQYANVNPGVSLKALQALISWGIKTLVRGQFDCIGKLATNFHNSQYATRTDLNPKFYSWLQERESVMNESFE